jgi:hypothetical protein
MPKGPRCTICNNEEVGLIDASVESGHMTLNRVAHRFGISIDALTRHRAKGHVMGKGVETPAYQPPPPDPDADDTATMRREALNLLRSLDPSKLGPSMLISRVNAIRLMSEAIDAADPPSRTEIDVHEIPGYDAMMGDWFLLLEKHPEIRAEFLEIVRKHQPGVAPES